MLLQFFSAVDIVYYAMFPQIGLLQRQQCSDVILAFIESKIPCSFLGTRWFQVSAMDFRSLPVMGNGLATESMARLGCCLFAWH